jgi:hypothetical protein
MFGTAFTTDAIGVLKEHHREIEDLLERVAHLRAAQRQAALPALRQALAVQVALEQRLFLPACRAAGMSAALLAAAELEQQDVARHAEGLAAAALGAGLDARLQALAAHVHGHLDTLEEEVMPRARALVLDLDALGEEMIALKTRLDARATRPGGRRRVAWPADAAAALRLP